MSKMGEQEVTDWMAFYQLEQEDDRAELERARRDAAEETKVED